MLDLNNGIATHNGLRNNNLHGAIHWTPSLVEERLKEAADVLKRLPPVRVPGYFSVWPKIIPEFGDLVGQKPEPMRFFCHTSPAEISRMEGTLGWTVGLDPVDAKIIWMHAFGKPWKHICAQSGISRATANEHLLVALSIIAARLNGKPFPKKLSRNKILATARYQRDRLDKSN
jgi:hypothetical protein